MPRDVKEPRVVMPTTTVSINSLATLVASEMDDDPDFNGVDPASLKWIAIKDLLENDGQVGAAKLASAKEKEADASILRAELAINNQAILAELRNARDLIFGLFPENPMKVASYGFTAYNSVAGQSPPTLNDDGTEDGDGDPLTPA